MEEVIGKLIMEAGKQLTKELIKILVKKGFTSLERKEKEDEGMLKEEAYEVLLESISSYYSAVGNPKRLKILLELRKQFIDGMKWAELKELTDLSSGALKRHIDILIDVGLVGKSKSSYRVTRSGLGLLTQVDEVKEAIKEILSDKEQLKEILSQL
jgi:DNA-binding MarR family transcriptional regulator